MKKTSVLLVDKHPALVESLCNLLKTLFETVLMVSDEKSMLEAVKRFDPDLIVVDLDVPVTGAQSVAGLLSQYDPGLKFIVLSNTEQKEVMEKCKSSGATGYILKRSSARQLIRAVETAQKGGTFFSVYSEIRE
jgi:DNA-binding NarL/FixJ family response regulator